MNNEEFILWLSNRIDHEYSGDYDALEYANKLVAVAEKGKALNAYHVGCPDSCATRMAPCVCGYQDFKAALAALGEE